MSTDDFFWLWPVAIVIAAPFLAAFLDVLFHPWKDRDD